MDIQVEQADKFTHKLSVTIPSEDVDKAFKDSFKKVAKSARIPGFRPGKIPRGVLEARFGNQVKSDVFQQLLDSSLQAALIQKELNPVSQPKVEPGALNQGTEFNLSEKQLAKLKRPNSVTVKRMRTNALVEGMNAKLQRIFYTIAKQRRGGFRASMEQAVKISNNTLNRTLGMTPNEAVKLLKIGEPLKRRDGKHPKPIMKKNAYKVGMKVRALKTARAASRPLVVAWRIASAQPQCHSQADQSNCVRW